MLSLISACFKENLRYAYRGILVNAFFMMLFVVMLTLFNGVKMSDKDILMALFGVGCLLTVIHGLVVMFLGNKVWYKIKFRLIPVKEWQLYLGNVMATLLLILMIITGLFLVLGLAWLGLMLMSQPSYSIEWLFKQVPTTGSWYLGALYIFLFMVMGAFLLFLLAMFLTKTFVPRKWQKISLVVMIYLFFKLYNVWAKTDTKDFLSIDMTHLWAEICVGIVILTIMSGLSIVLLKRVEATGNQEMFY